MSEPGASCHEGVTAQHMSCQQWRLGVVPLATTARWLEGVDNVCLIECHCRVRTRVAESLFTGSWLISVRLFANAMLLSLIEQEGFYAFTQYLL